MAGKSAYSTIAAPPNAIVAINQQRELLQLLQRSDEKQGNIGFALGHLADRLDRCQIFLSQHVIEIAPAFLPSQRILFLSDHEIRRIYLSATLTSEVDFCRAFGRRPSIRIEPESDAGIGERLIIYADREKLTEDGRGGVTDERVARRLVSEQKLLISTPTYSAATKYKNIATPPRVEEFSVRLEEFRRRSTPAAFVLVGRIDGIDLPHATCRVMLADGLPTGFSLFETYLYDAIEMRNSFAAKLANRITQMFGRTNRGRNDYSVIFITDRRFVNWLSTPRNVALLPELLRKQLLLGKSLVEQFKVSDVQTFPQLAKQVIDRDPAWLGYYTDSIGGLDVGEDQRDEAAQNDQILTEAALAEGEFAAHMWDGNTVQARQALGTIVDKVVVADRRLAGWYNIQIGHAFEIENDGEAAAKQYSQARARIQHLLALPYPETTASLSKEHPPKNLLHSKLLEIFANDVRIQNDHIDRYKRAIAPAFDKNKNAGDHEEALRTLGELLGFVSTRPEQDEDNDSTLDVLWVSQTAKQGIPLSLKTKKKSKGAINQTDVGDAFNHLQWLSKSHNEIQVLGLIFVSEVQECTKAAAPSNEMWVTGTERIERLYDDTIQMLLSLQRMKPLDRYVEIAALSVRAEWQAEAIFEKIRGRRLIDTKK